MPVYKSKLEKINLIQPLVSVIVPTYNARRYILQSIQSVLDQTYDNFELIIVDDGSTDETYNLILDTFSGDSRIRLIRICNSGVAVALNSGIELSRGKYIARLDADDIAVPNRLRQQVNFMESNKNIGVLGSAAIKINAKGKNIGEMRKYNHNYQLKWLLMFNNAFIHPTVMIRRDLLLQVGCYNNVKSEDGDLWVRLAKITRFYNLDLPLIKYRIHDDQTTTVNKLYDDDNNRDVYDVKLNYWKFVGLPKLSFDVFLVVRLSKSLNKKQFKEFFHFIWQANSSFVEDNANMVCVFKQKIWFLYITLRYLFKYL